jgi:hypothetical protein
MPTRCVGEADRCTSLMSIPATRADSAFETLLSATN